MNVSRRVTSTVAKSVAGRVTVVGNEVGPISSFSVATLNPLQWTHDASTPYYDANSPLDGIAVLNSRESYGDYRAPLPPYCAKFDGSNDRASLGDQSYPGSGGAYTIAAWVMLESGTYGGIVGMFGNSNWAMYIEGLKFRLRHTVSGNYDCVSTTSVSLSTWYHVSVTYDVATATAKIYVNGVLENTVTSFTAIGTIGLSKTSIGIWSSTNGSTYAIPLNGKLCGVQAWTVAKNDSQIAEIYSGAIDLESIWAIWNLNEQSGTVHYDSSGNARHLTIYNAVTTLGGGYHVTDADLPGNISNSLGYSLSGTVVIPRDESDTANDVLGNPLDYAGQCPYPVNPLVPCVSNNGAGTVYISAPHLTGSETVSSYSGSTATPTISSGRIDWDASTTLGDITLSDGTRYTCQEGIGSGSNRTLYDVSGSANDATLVNGVAADIWAATLNDVEDWSIKYGGGTGAGGEFIPGNTSGSLCVDGSSKTIPAGTPNAATILDLNPFGAGELTSRSVPTDFADGDDLNATVTPTDSAFASTDRIKIVVLPEAATGDDLTGMEDYVS